MQDKQNAQEAAALMRLAQGASIKLNRADKDNQAALAQVRLNCLDVDTALHDKVHSYEDHDPVSLSGELLGL